MAICSNCGSDFDNDFKYCPKCGTIIAEAPSPSKSLVGKTLNDKYRILARIGSGSMGTVYEAEHTGLKKKIALKVLHPDLHVNEDTLRRFQQEGVAAGRFTHPNAIQIFDFDRADDRLFFLAMEFVEGRSLKDWIQEAGALSVEDTVHILRQVLSALAEAHKQGIIHRDLKPDNIMGTRGATGQMSIKVLDFGISKLVDLGGGSDALMTQTGRIMGTPMYMAPEQCSGSTVDHRCDLYAAGLVTFEMLTGHPPFRGETVNEILYKHTTEKSPELKSVKEELVVPHDLEEIIQKSLNKKREERFQTAEEMIRALDSIRYDIEARPRAREAASRSGKPAFKPLGLAVVGVLVAALAIFGGWSFFQGGFGSSESAIRVSLKQPDRLTKEEGEYLSLLETARGSLERRDAPEALDAVEAALRLPCSDSEGYLVRGKVYLQRKDPATARADFEEALAMDPTYAEAMCGVGWALREMEKQQEALARFTKASETDPNLGEARLGIGVLQYEDGRQRAAQEALLQAKALDSSSALVHYFLARIHVDRRETEEAIASFVQAKRHDSKLWEAYEALGSIYESRGDLDQAEQHMREALNLNPESLSAMTSLASILIQQERYIDAEPLLEESLNLDPDAGRSLILIGVINIAQGNPDEAIDPLEKGIELSPDEVDAPIILGILYQQKGRFEDAIERYKYALGMDESRQEARKNMGLSYMSLQQYENARIQLELALELDPDDPFTHYGLGVLFKDYLLDENLARQHFSRYEALGGTDPKVLEWLKK